MTKFDKTNVMMTIWHVLINNFARFGIKCIKCSFKIYKNWPRGWMEVIQSLTLGEKWQNDALILVVYVENWSKKPLWTWFTINLVLRPARMPSRNFLEIPGNFANLTPMNGRQTGKSNSLAPVRDQIIWLFV